MRMSDYVYPCSAGETFDSVALAVYKDEKYAAELLCANPELCGKILFTGGETLLLPALMIAEEGEESLPQTAPWRQ